MTLVTEAPTAISEVYVGPQDPRGPVRIRPVTPTLEDLADDSTGDVDVNAATRVQEAPQPHTLVMDPYAAAGVPSGSGQYWAAGAGQAGGYPPPQVYPPQIASPLGNTAPMSPGVFPSGVQMPPPTGLPMVSSQMMAPQFQQYAGAAPPRTLSQQMQTLPLYVWALIGVGGGLLLLFIVAGVLYFLLTRS